MILFCTSCIQLSLLMCNTLRIKCRMLTLNCCFVNRLGLPIAREEGCRSARLLFWARSCRPTGLEWTSCSLQLWLALTATRASIGKQTHQCSVTCTQLLQLLACTLTMHVQTSVYGSNTPRPCPISFACSHTLHLVYQAWLDHWSYPRHADWVRLYNPNACILTPGVPS